MWGARAIRPSVSNKQKIKSCMKIEFKSIFIVIILTRSSLKISWARSGNGGNLYIKAAAAGCDIKSIVFIVPLSHREDQDLM